MGAINDWTNLPDGTEAISLWDSVHDGELRGIHSDLLARTLAIRFSVPYLLSFHNLPDNLDFTFLLEGVQSVRGFRFAIWPGEFSLPDGLKWEEQELLRNEYRSKWRQESESWSKIESEVNNDADAELTDGDVALSGGVALRLGVRMSGGEWYEVFVRAEHLAIHQSNNENLDLKKFLQLGEAYWRAFAERNPR